MKKLLITAMLMLYCTSITVHAEEPELKEVHATIYCSGTKCADGTKVHYGVCATDKEHLGQTALLYTLEMELLGIFECCDLGGKGIQSGNVIDIYFPTKEEGQEFIDRTYEENAHGKVYVQYVDAVG